MSVKLDITFFLRMDNIVMERMDTRIEEEKSTTCAQLRIGYLEENLLFQTIQPKIDRTEASIFSSILNFGDALFNLETEWIANFLISKTGFLCWPKKGLRRMYRVSALVQYIIYSFDVEAPFVSCTNFLLVVGLSQQQFDQTLGVDPHSSSSSFDQTSLVLAFSVSCRQTMWGFLSLTFTQFSETYSSLETIPPF